LAWKKVNLTCNKNDANFIEEILFGYGAISISMIDRVGDNPIYEPDVGETPLWETIEISALFEKNITKGIICNILERISYTNLDINNLEDQNWVEKFQENSKPIKFGKKLWVVPSWNKLLIPDGIKLKMDPGMAFGSGSHETTQLCLEYLENNTLEGLTILDYGCGSGILSIASLLLGANYTIATDIDPQALKATKENSTNNKVIDRIEIVKPDLIPNIKIDLIVANILSNILIDNRNSFSNLLEPSARLILSGIMRSQLENVIDYYEEFFTIHSVKYKNDWCLVEFMKN